MKNALLIAVTTATLTALAVAAVLFLHDRHQKIEAQRLAAQVNGLAYVAQGLNLLGTAKTLVSERWSETGELPTTNEAAGLHEPTYYASDAVTRLDVGKGGVITVTFNEKSGVAGGTLRFTPDTSKPDLGLRFRCTTPSYPDVQTFVPQCTYEKGG